MANPTIGDTWYRYRDCQTASLDQFDYVQVSDPFITVDYFKVEKVTPKGVWLRRSTASDAAGSGHCFGDKRFVRTSAVKLFAHPTKEAAVQALMARKRAQIRILQNQLAYAIRAMSMAQCTLAALPSTSCKDSRNELQALLV